MRCVQVEALDRVARLALLEGGRVLVLARPHESVATSLDLLTAASERTVDAAAWVASARRAGAFEEMFAPSTYELTKI